MGAKGEELTPGTIDMGHGDLHVTYETEYSSISDTVGIAQIVNKEQPEMIGKVHGYGGHIEFNKYDLEQIVKHLISVGAIDIRV
jgi:hypothetical protein